MILPNAGMSKTRKPRTFVCMTRKVRIHDGVIAALLLTSAALGNWVDARFWWLAPLTGLIMLQSAFTGFCPVHYTVNKLVKD
jgi:hypothetical protein